MTDFVGWASAEEEMRRGQNFKGYIQGVSQSRFITRKITRIADEAARSNGLDPLHHQALLHIYGSSPQNLTINKLAERLDVVPAFTSRITKDLESNGLIRRERTDEDRRVIRVVATELGRETLRAIDSEVHFHAQFFQHQLTEDERVSALVVFAFMLGVTSVGTEEGGANPVPIWAKTSAAKARAARPRATKAVAPKKKAAK